MSGLQRIVRHPDRLNDPHARAHELASSALLERLPEADALWLEEHLAGCDPCRIVARTYADDAAVLRAARVEPPPVPRDLGARVSLALDEEVRRATRGHRVAGGRRAGPRVPAAAYAGLVGVAIVALVVAPLALPPGTPVASAPSSGTDVPAVAVPTPITVDSQPVAFVRRAPDGTYVISSADVEAVCAGTDVSACGTLDATTRTLGSLAVAPSSVALPRDGGPAVVVGGDSVFIVPFAASGPVTSPEPGSSSVPTTAPVQSPAASGGPATPPVDSPAPSGDPASPAPTADASSQPSTEPGSPAPTGEPSPVPTAEVSPVPSPSPAPATPQPTMPPATPAPSAAPAIAIAEQVVLVGTPPAYSPDGRWVAFSARPASGEHGPDVYAWRVGSDRAAVLTDDHGSVFSGWLGDRILASTARLVATTGAPVDEVPAPDADPATVTARSFLLDPASGDVAPIEREDVWRPVIDPTDRLAVYWSGALAWSASQRAWVPFDGRLVLAAWPDLRDGAPDRPPRTLPRAAAATPTRDFEVRFDPAGRRLAVWVGDAADPGSGRLALVVVEAGGSLGDVVLADAAALPGFSLDADRLAWSTPPGRNGKGSQVTVYAWRGDNAGQISSAPDTGDDPVLVAH